MFKNSEFLTDTPFWFSDFYKSLEKRDVFSRKTKAIIASTGKSREYICRLFKSATGSTIGEHLNNIRINHAAELLANTQMDIIDIALESGFDNLSTFYHLFKRLKGISPKKYRKTHSN